ncbi:MAG: S1/P1 nuclease [Pelagibacterales bacterium]|nr:S1/P1 nuclease [Pelagibacterales bacterium]
MKNKLLIFLILSSVIFPWGKTGHRVTGEVAESYLSEKTKQEIKNILVDSSLATASTWADEMRSNPDFKIYDVWHYANIPLDTEYSEIQESKNEDIVQAIKLCKNKLKSSDISKEEKAFYLRYLIHFIGDIHQPMHVGRAEDRGGNSIKLQWFGNPSNLHRVWDSEMINSYMMSYTELAFHLNAKFDSKEVQILSEDQWIYESHQLVKKIYAETKDGDYIGYDYIYQNFDLVKSQLFIAGVRLGYTLNNIFDE